MLKIIIMILYIILLIFGIVCLGYMFFSMIQSDKAYKKIMDELDTRIERLRNEHDKEAQDDN